MSHPIRSTCLAALTLVALAAPPVLAEELADVRYKTISGVDAKYHSLDVYSPNQGGDLPVLVYIHGGSWQKGDKGEVQRALSFMDQLERRQHVLVSINFRPWPQATYAEQCADIAAGLRWVNDEIKNHKGSKDKVFLVGHSSGAHLVSLLGTDASYLKAQRLDLNFLKGIIPLDIQAYDIPRAISTADSLGWPAAKRTLEKVFGTDLATQENASPITHLKRGQSYPAFHVVYAGFFGKTPQRISEDQSLHFGDALKAAGVTYTVNTDGNENHVSLVHDFGDPADAITVGVEAFMDEVLLKLSSSGKPMGQTQRGQGQTQRGQGQTQRGQGQTQRGQGQTQRGQGQTQRGQGQTQRGQGQTQRGQGQTQRGQGQTQRGQGQTQRGQTQRGQRRGRRVRLRRGFRRAFR